LPSPVAGLPSPVAGLAVPGPVIPGVRDVIALFTFVPALRKVRAGDDGELGGGSGISQANAAGETVGVWSPGGEEPDDPLPEVAGPEDAVPEGAVPEDAGPDAAGPIWSAGTAGMSARVASASAPRAPSWPEASAGPAADGVPVTWSVSLAGVSLAATVPLALRSDMSPLAGAVVTGEAPVAGLRAVRLRGAAIMSEARVSESSSTSSTAREVTMVGEAPPEPSGPLVRLSKPSSLCPDPHEVISGRDAHMTTGAKKTAFCRTSLALWDAPAPEIVALTC
jgi:hypothetical protein